MWIFFEFTVVSCLYCHCYLGQGNATRRDLLLADAGENWNLHDSWPRFFEVVTWLTSKSLIANLGDSVRVLSLCLDPISINSVLVIFRVSLFALSQL